MIELKKIELSDYSLIKSYFDRFPSQSCDRTAGAIVMWRDYFHYHYALCGDNMVIVSPGHHHTYFYYPVGGNPEAVLDEIDEYCVQKGIKPSFASLSAEENEILSKRYPGSVSESERDWFDYIYDYESLTSLVGKKHAHQRNQIHKFEHDSPEFVFEKITAENIPEVKKFNRNFKFHAEKESGSAERELAMCLEVLDNYDVYAQRGALLRVGGKVVGYTLGEISGDTLFVHVEKADTSYRGVYQMLSNLFLKSMEGESIKFVNREEDCGDPGLRQSKMSYAPLFLLEKWTLYLS